VELRKEDKVTSKGTRFRTGDYLQSASEPTIVQTAAGSCRSRSFSLTNGFGARGGRKMGHTCAKAL